MSIFSLHRKQLIKAPLEEVWAFFSSPHNLKLITPINLDFKVIECPEVQEIYPGMLIKYIVKPLFGIPWKWITKIEDVQRMESFSDVQIKGPYKQWKHFHSFTETEEGVVMVDMVKYSLNFGLLNGWINKLLIEKRLKEIFDYRRDAVEKIFKTYDYAG
jgi:ligand-binding SRPBCC domain-containing protein